MTSDVLRPALSFAPELLLRAQDIRLVFFDVDGVLTDGCLYFSETGETLERFSLLDGLGFHLLHRAGIITAVITERNSAALRTRLKALKVQHAVYGAVDKLLAAEKMLGALGLTWQQTAVLGNDWPDLPLLVRAQLACASANAHIENKALAHHVSHFKGGDGAGRELCDLVLMAQGHYMRYWEIARQ